MKNILMIISMLVAGSALAQKTAAPIATNFPIDSETQLVSYTEVVKVEGLDKNALYDRAQEWIKTYFKNPASVTKRADREAGEVDLYYGFYCMKDVKGVENKGDFIRYSTTILFKDGRYKYTITKINVDRESYYGIEKWLKPEFADDETVQSNLQQITKFMNDYMTAMKKGITPAAAKKDDNW